MLSFFFIFSFASAFLKVSIIPYSMTSFELTQSVGENCGPTNIYDIYGVDIEPWPPTPGLFAQMNMTGLFLQNGYIQQVVLGTCYNGMVWNYNTLPITSPFVAGEEAIFLIGIVFPTEPGNYINNIQINTDVHISCWQYSYIIS